MTDVFSGNGLLGCQGRAVQLRASQFEFALRDLGILLLRHSALLAYLTHSLRQLRFSACQRGCRVDGVQAHQHLPGFNQRRVVDRHFDHRARDLRRHADLRTGHIGVVGVFAQTPHIVRHQPPDTP